MATFSFIKFYGIQSPSGNYANYGDADDFTAYINNDKILSFRESMTCKESFITMDDGTTFFINKPLVDLMNEFGKIQYIV